MQQSLKENPANFVYVREQSNVWEHACLQERVYFIKMAISSSWVHRNYETAFIF